MGNKQKGEKHLPAGKFLIIEGIVLGERLAFESSLAGYLVRLERSSLFGGASIKNRVIDRYEEKDVLKFTARLVIL